MCDEEELPEIYPKGDNSDGLDLGELACDFIDLFSEKPEPEPKDCGPYSREAKAMLDIGMQRIEDELASSLKSIGSEVNVIEAQIEDVVSVIKYYIEELGATKDEAVKTAFENKLDMSDLAKREVLKRLVVHEKE